MNATDSVEKVLVWDLPVRIGHWLMVGCFVVAWLTGESEEWRNVHVLAGGGLVGVAVFRVLWGLIGSRHALFVDFVRGPDAAWAYLKSLLRSSPQHFVGHNPAGGWAIVLLLALAVMSGITGWLNFQDIGGDRFEELHEASVHAMLIVVLVHLAGVLVGSIVHRENLARAMLTGQKLGQPEDAISRLHWIAAAALLIWSFVVATALSQ
jgi:cytochrome b